MTVGWRCLAVAVVFAACPTYGNSASPPWLSPLTTHSLLIEAGRLARTVDMGNPAEVAYALGVKLRQGIAHPPLPIAKPFSFPLSERQLQSFIDYTVEPRNLGTTISYTTFQPTTLRPGVTFDDAIGEVQIHLPKSAQCFTFETAKHALGIQASISSPMLAGFQYKQSHISSFVEPIDPVGVAAGRLCFLGMAIIQGKKSVIDREGTWVVSQKPY